MMNPAGSGSSACVNIEPRADLVAAAERFLTALQWRGLFMIELLRDTSGKFWFMELNGRPWGSMALARRVGLEYPAWAINALTTPGYRPTLPVLQPPVLCRHVGRELTHLAFAVRGPSRDDTTSAWPSFRRSLVDMLQLSGRQAVYNWRSDDSKVFFYDVLGSLDALTRSQRRAVKAKVGKLRLSGIDSLRRRYETLVERIRQKRLRANGLPADTISKARSVLFVCYGNINRSALAERHFQQLVRSGLSIASCGFHADIHRPADPHMVAVAGSAGVDLNGWSSQALTAKLVEDADVIFAMESQHLVRLHLTYPRARGKSFLLGAVLAPLQGPLEISDPFGKQLAVYERCFREVTAATTALSGYFVPGSQVSIEPLRSPAAAA
jgi:protein-tyrosine-phosphatase